MKKIVSVLLIAALCIGLSVPVAADDNLLRNAGFEESSGGSDITYWSLPGNAARNTDARYVRSGTASLRISTDTYNYPHVGQSWTVGIVGGAEYTASVWLYAMNANTGLHFRLYCYDKDNQIFSDIWVENRYNASPGGWEQHISTFRLPKGTERVTFFMRMGGTGTVYADDISCKMTDGPEKIYQTAINGTFYYTESTKPGVMTADMDTDYYPSLVGETVHFALEKDGVTIWAEDVTIPADGHVSFTFPLTLLSEKQTPYTVSCTYAEAGGATAVKSHTVYRYDRPTQIDENGFFRDENGEIFTPTTMFGVGLDDLDTLKAAGINTIQGYPSGTWLDTLYEKGMKCFVVLYSGSQTAGNPARLSTTKGYVRTYKNHPAVLGWEICDEPNTTEESLSELAAAYTAIREIDPAHPVVITANSGCDILHGYSDAIISDSYPYNNDRFVKTQGVGVGLAVENSDGRPVYALLQAFEHLNSFPTPEKLRNMQYASLFAGAKGLGYYKYRGSQGDTWLRDTVLWDGLCDFAAGEQGFAYDTFVNRKYEKLGGADTDTHEWGLWQSGAEDYLIVRSKQNTAFAADISLPGITVGSAEVLYGATQTVRIGNGSVQVTLSAADVAVIRLRPGNASLFGADAHGAFTAIPGTATAENFSVQADGSLLLKSTDGMPNPRIRYTFADDRAPVAGKNYVLRFWYKPLSEGQAPIIGLGKNNPYQDRYLSLSGSAFRAEEKTNGFWEYTAYFTMPETDSSQHVAMLLASYGTSSDGYYDCFYLAEDTERVLLTDTNGMAVTEIRGGMTLFADIHFLAMHEKAQGENVMMIFALYRKTEKGKRCVGLLLDRAGVYKEMPVHNNSGETLYLTSASDLHGSVTVPPGGGTYSYKCFYWNESLQSLRAALTSI